MIKQFYTYLIRDPRNNTSIYIGKGKGSRWRTHLINGGCHNLRLQRTIAKIRKLGLEPDISIIAYFDNEVDAFASEIKLIAQYGRADLGKGTLYNLTDGGEGSSGCIAVIEAMRKLNANSEFVKTKSEQLRKLNADPEFARATAERARKLHANPQYAKWHAERIRKFFSNPQSVKEHASHARKLHANPVFKARHKAGIDAYWQIQREQRHGS